jgi:hypothetical protein
VLEVIRFNSGRLTEAGRAHPLGRAMEEYFAAEAEMAATRERDPLAIMGGASFSDYAEKAVLELIAGKAELAKPTFWLALCVVVPTDVKTGSNIEEATYTGYARLKIEGAKWTASGISPTAIKTNEELKFAACTASSSTIIGWAGCDASTAGNMLCWGTATSTVISTTQTPATIASGGLEITLD